MHDALSATFAALADPTRRAILARLARGPATINEIAQPFDLTLATVSRHVKVLEEAGIVVKERSAQFRPCRLEPAPLEAAEDWLEHYREFFAQRFDRLDAQLKAMTRPKRTARGEARTGSKRARRRAGGK